MNFTKAHRIGSLNKVRFFEFYLILCGSGLAVTLTPWHSAAICLDPPGDVTGDGVTSVVDVQCILLGVLAGLSGGETTQVVCAAQPDGADLDCNDSVTVGDVFLVIQVVLGTPWSNDVDKNGDLCADTCVATCGDGICDGESAENCVTCAADCVCDDGNECTADDCDAVQQQCSFTPVADDCDDGNPCTAADQCLFGQCQSTNPICPNSACTNVDASKEMEYAVGCSLSGKKGNVVNCDILVIRANKSAPIPHAIQMAVVFEQPLQFVSIFDHFCGGGANCAECDVYKLKLSSGHLVSTAPNPQQKWNDPSCEDNNPFVCKPDKPTNCLDGPCAGGGGLVLLPFPDPVNPLTNAYVHTNGTIVGNPKVATLRFTLEKDVDATNPVDVIFWGVTVLDYIDSIPALVEQNQIIVLSKN